MADVTEGAGDVIERFGLNGRVCFIRHVRDNTAVLAQFPWLTLPPQEYTGYVEVFGDYEDYDGENPLMSLELTEEITYFGRIEAIPCIGFDTVHAHDTRATQTLEAVRQRLWDFCESLEASGGDPR